MVKEIVRSARESDVDYLVENIRREDEIELYALDGSTIRESLDETPDLIKNSLVWEVDGKLVCMFGVTPVEGHDGAGVAWLLATKEFEKYTKMFAVRCKRVFLEVVKGYDYLFNYIHSENKSSIKWLKWLGFTICDAEPLGNKGANFHRFEMINV